MLTVDQLTIEGEKKSPLEQVCQLMIKHGFATGHGDTLEDVLTELDWQLGERREWADRLRNALGRTP